MKDNDEVRLIVEKEKYAQEGVHKGAQGTICDPRNINGNWLVNFRQEDGLYGLACMSVKEEDLEVIWEAPVLEGGATVLFLSEKEKYKVQGITNGMFGVICEQCEDENYWNVKFVLSDGTEKTIPVYYNDMVAIRNDEVEAYKQEVAKELKRRQNG